MNIEADRKRLKQSQLLDRMQGNFEINEMISVFRSDESERHSFGLYCALIPKERIEQVFACPRWDLTHGQGLPGTIDHGEDGEKHVEYLRFGRSDGIEPLIIDREFYGIREGYKEICEEFRFFHHLYYDQRQGSYIKIDDYGNEDVVAIVEPNQIQIRLKEIRQFLAVKEMSLSIQFDSVENSKCSLSDLGLERGGGNFRRGPICWSLHYDDRGEISGRKAFSRLLGKRLFEPFLKSKSDFCDYAEEKPDKHIDFIINLNENGDEITYTSDPDVLDGYFGENPGNPQYLTAVHFRKQVLEKYYQQPGKYEVVDSMIRCGHLWSMSIDNHHNDKVCVWLGDLGRDLPYEDKLHWRAYNIPPQGNISGTYFRRQILSEWATSDYPEHVFHRLYRELLEVCNECLGWPLILPLEIADEHSLKCVRVPSTDEQRDFDNLVSGLTKVLIDSLNEKQLVELIPCNQRKDIRGGISRLEMALSVCGVSDSTEHILFLRKLQDLRSSGSAHRKGGKYAKIATEFGVDNNNLCEVFTGILEKAIALMKFLIDVVRSGKLTEAKENMVEEHN